MTNQSQLERRWENYLIYSGQDFQTFWTERLSEKRDILFVLGWGFDPRMCIGLEKFLECGSSGVRHCWLLDYEEGSISPSRVHDDIRTKNLDRFNRLIMGRMQKTDKKIAMVDEEGLRVESRNAAALFVSLADLKVYDDIIVDISALPPSIYFPILGKLLHLMDKAPNAVKVPNLHVIVAENAELDMKIKDQEIEDDAKYLFGFTSDLLVEASDLPSSATMKIPKVWIPIVGEDKSTQLERIEILIKPAEICPVLPSPSMNPRRSDDLVLEYRELFFRLKVELRNVVYGSEQNPFEVYREISETIEKYREALDRLGGCKIVISALSSKLLSISALLVAYEAMDKKPSVGIAHVLPRGYRIDSTYDISLAANSKLFSLWIAGDAYAK